MRSVSHIRQSWTQPAPPLVEDDGAVPSRDRPQRGVGDRDPPARAADDRRLPRVDAGREQDVGARGPEPHHGVLQRGGQPVGVGAGAQQVVAAGDQADQVRPRGQRHRHLLLDHLTQQSAADGEVGVLQVTVGRGRQVLGQPVGPAAVLPRPLRVGIGQPLGEGVAEGDVAAPGRTGGLQLHPSTPARSPREDRCRVW
jgi:hypothetical protein